MTIPAELRVLSLSNGGSEVDGLILSRSSKTMSLAMSYKLSLSLQIEEWTREAFVLWGDDWERIADHIRARFAELGEAERAKFLEEASLTLLDPAGRDRDASTN
jgi:hypothetical protein